MKGHVKFWHASLAWWHLQYQCRGTIGSPLSYSGAGQVEARGEKTFHRKIEVIL
jgi:hypothetical protein